MEKQTKKLSQKQITALGVELALYGLAEYNKGRTQAISEFKKLREILYEGSMDYINCKYCANFIKNKLKAIKFIDDIIEKTAQEKKA